VAYAGTGRTPFHADSPPATAARILTQPPDLTGLPDSLRNLVAPALEKDPANRPTARELLDLLVAGPQRPAATTAALADQPGLRFAAEEAQAVTGLEKSGPPTTTTVPPGLSDMVGYQEESIVTQVVPVVPADPPARPTRRRRWALPVMAVVVLLGIVAGIGMVRSAWPFGTATVLAPKPVPSASTDDRSTLFITDGLRGAGYWQATHDARERAACTFHGGLVARRETRGSFRCRGPQDAEPADVRTEVGVRLSTPDSCASIWFRFHENKGYQVRVCANNIYVGTHKSATTEVYRTFPLYGDPIPLDGPPTRITVEAAGDTVEVLRDGVRVGRVPLRDTEITGGRVLLGVFSEQHPVAPGPFQVVFEDIKIWTLDR
jgi:hypothetical protein